MKSPHTPLQLGAIFPRTRPPDLVAVRHVCLAHVRIQGFYVPSPCKVKISADPQNLPVFLSGNPVASKYTAPRGTAAPARSVSLRGSVGDILESFFKSTNYLRPSDGSSVARMGQWARLLKPGMSAGLQTCPGCRCPIVKTWSVCVSGQRHLCYGSLCPHHGHVDPAS